MRNSSVSQSDAAEKKYSVLAKLTVELRKKSTRVDFSDLSKAVLVSYAKASPMAKELVEHELEQGRPVTPATAEGVWRVG